MAGYLLTQTESIYNFVDLQSYTKNIKNYKKMRSYNI